MSVANARMAEFAFEQHRFEWERHIRRASNGSRMAVPVPQFPVAAPTEKFSSTIEKRSRHRIHHARPCLRRRATLPQRGIS
jgi:hypothetical protein